MSTAPTSHPIHTIIARAASIVGHPLIFLPTAALVAATEKGASMQQLKLIGLILAALGLAVMAYSYFQVRSGHWSHIDASARSERKSLNLFLATLCLLTAGVLWFLTDRPHMTIALALSGTLFLMALLTARWVKLSLHTAFAVFATALLWPNLIAVTIGAIMTTVVIWSRLVLRRHGMVDIMMGLLVGVIAGVIYQQLSI